ncbi:MAG: hypothetical protein HC836_19250 [Richelia sp. RM2_1_2]|nr:hypothetical protein [Richelia sp. RM2_1_2]
MSKQSPVYPILLIPESIKDKDFFPSIFTFDSVDDIPIGASEIDFGFLLRYYFGTCIREQQQLLPSGHNRPFSTDFLFIEPLTGLHIDIEVDEPFAFSTGEPIHCVGEDDYRNKCFSEANFVVMRFAEEQVRSQPLRCMRFLGNVVNQLTENDTWKQQFAEVERITTVKQWTKYSAKKLKKQDYRKQYLN